MNTTTRVLLAASICVALGACAKKVKEEPAAPVETPATTAPVSDGRYTPADLDTDACLRQRTVYFDFDKDTLRPDAVAILDEAVAILQKYPQLRVEVAGHTDSIGTEQYNQGLSERRAKAVYNYLTGKGIDAGRLVGPNGFGESRPIDTNDTKEGRARNRRTELNVQN